MQGQQDYEIIDLVVTIFQNVGIKRCIDKIDILKNYQIYFEICKVIFPQTMIQLLRFSEGPQANAEKIQGVIDIIGKILQNDLYHISGKAIAEGKLSHIKNFLHILELLSQNVHKGNRNDEQVESAPQNTKSISDYDQQGHYTVIGINKQFQRQFDDEDGQYSNPKKQQNVEQQTENQDSQSQKPMNPVLDQKIQTSKKKLVKNKSKSGKKIEKNRIQELRSKPNSQSLKYSFKKHQNTSENFQDFINRRKPKQQIQKKAKSSFVRKINNIIEDFEAKRLTDKKLEYNIWAKRYELKANEKENQIEQENKERMNYASQLIVQRKSKINTLKRPKHALSIMENLNREQRNIQKRMKKAKKEAQLENIESFIQKNQQDKELLRSALMAGNLGVSHKKRQ